MQWCLFLENNYELSIAFFILAGKIDDAVKIALEKLHDLNLAILITRLTERRINMQNNLEPETTCEHKLVDKYFIKEGQKVEDPFLVSIGYWWKGKHVDALNQINKMVDDSFNKDENNSEESESDDDQEVTPVLQVGKQTSRPKSPKKKDENHNVSSGFEFNYPIISGIDIFVLDLIEALMDHHIIRRQIEQSKMQQDFDDDDGGSIFDDFFGGGAQKK
jgi:hypothetical protein